MNGLFFVLIHPSPIGPSSLLLFSLSLYIVEIKFTLRNRHRQRVETMQLCMMVRWEA
jgi:hypothetical protein